MKLVEIGNMMNAKENQQVWSIGFCDNETGPRVSVNEQLAEELH